MIWHSKNSIEEINNSTKNTLISLIGIEFFEIGDHSIKAKMPVDNRTIQPAGILHGGASVVLAETIASVGSSLTIATESLMSVGLEINTNHVKSVSSGFVFGTGKPIHIGRSTQIWEIRIVTENDELVAISRITMAILKKRTK